MSLANFVKNSETIGGKIYIQGKEGKDSSIIIELPPNFSSLKYEQNEIIKKTESDNGFTVEKQKLRKIL